MDAVVQLVRYVKQAPGMGLLMSEIGDNMLKLYCDADWETCINSRRSITGYLVRYDTSLISWKLKKRATVSRSLAEAEYRVMESSIAKVIWLIGLFEELAAKVKVPDQHYK